MRSFFCKVCNPTAGAELPTLRKDPLITKVDSGFKCDQCGLITSTNYSMKRHIERKHSISEVNNSSLDNIEVEIGMTNFEEADKDKETNRTPPSDLETVLSSVGLETYGPLFSKEDITIEMLVDLDTEEFMNMTKELGIATWGQRKKLKKAIEELKNSMNEEIPKEPFAEYCESEMEDGGNGDDIEETTLSQHEQTGPEEVPVNGEGPVPEDLE